MLSKNPRDYNLSGILAVINNWFIPFIFALGCLSYLPGCYQPHETAKALLLQVPLCLIVTLHLMVVTIKGEGFRIPFVAVTILGLMGIAVVKMGWGRLTDTNLFTFEGLIRYTPPLLWLCLIYNLKHNIHKRIIASLLIAATLNAIIGCLQYWFNLSLIDQGASPAGLMGNRNPSAHFSVMGLLAGAQIYVHTASLKKRWFLCASMVVLSTYILFTTCRSALIALSLSACVFLLIDQIKHGTINVGFIRKRFIELIVSFLIFFTLSLTSNSGLNGQAWSTLIGKAQSTIQLATSLNNTEAIAKETGQGAGTRLHNLANSMQMLHDHPWGVGLGNWHVIYPLYANSAMPHPLSYAKAPRHAHNDYLELATELGIIGITLFMVLSGLIIHHSINLIKNKNSNPTQSLTIPIITAVAVISFLDFPHQLTIMPYISTFGIALLTPKKASLCVHGRRIGIVSLMFLTVISLTIIRYNHGEVRANLLYGKAIKEFNSGNVPAAVVSCEQILERKPLHYRANTMIAQLFKFSNPELALEHSTILLKAQPHLPNNLGLHAIALTRLGSYDEAIKYWEHLHRITPHAEQPMKEIAVIANATGNPTKALFYLRKLLEIKPNEKTYIQSIQMLESRLRLPTTK